MSMDLSLVTEIILEASVWSAIIRVYGVVSALGYSGSIKKKTALSDQFCRCLLNRKKLN